ncbi:MAG TPA: amidohydrolase [Gemmatimonadaceae bacterium]|nr:amidohydrolase [Gemmatimonadaceae bacterium]
MRFSSAVAICLLCASPTGIEAQSPAPAATPADLIVTNARIYTVDEGRPVAEAMAIRGSRVLFVGSERGALALRGAQTTLLDAGGATVIPGIADAHAHLLGLGFTLSEVDLVGTTSYEEVIARVAARAREVPAGTWILGHGWDQNDWPDTRLPIHDALSRAVPNHPVSLSRIDGHAVLANAAAMRLANVTASTRDPAGGRLERGAGGAPTGVFVDNAMDIIESRIPAPTHDQIRNATLAAIHEANRFGLTSIHDAGVAPEVIDVYEELARAGQQTLRNYVMVRGDDSTLAKYFRRGPQSALYDGHLWIRAIKLIADGAMGSRGAALLDPYSDDPNNRGLLLEPPGRIQDVAVRALRNGFQLNVHAIGDRANRLVLDAFEAALKQVPTADHRFRVEHVQLLNYADVPRFAELDVIPSMQTSHATSDMYWTPTRIGYGRTLGSYAWRSLLNTGVVIANGTDFPVEEVNPLRTFHSAVTRQDEHNWPAGGWFPDQRMTREEALKSMTIWAAYAAFQEHDLGSLTPGKYADFVILDRDIMRIAPEDILGTQVVATYIGGRAVYQKSK